MGLDWAGFWSIKIDWGFIKVIIVTKKSEAAV